MRTEGNKLIITNVKTKQEYVYIGCVASPSILVPYRDIWGSKKYWEHHFIPKNEWLEINKIDFKDFDITKEEYQKITEKAKIRNKEILEKFHASF